ncbi:hypothetical protein L345_01409, partial [Ophiophagus hannah]
MNITHGLQENDPGLQRQHNGSLFQKITLCKNLATSQTLRFLKQRQSFLQILLLFSRHHLAFSVY